MADTREAYVRLPGEAGELSLFIGEQGRRAPAGSFAHAPAGVVHGFRVESEEARYLIRATPRHGEFYRAISVSSAAGGGPPDEPFDFSGLGAIAREHGIEVVGPLPRE